MVVEYDINEHVIAVLGGSIQLGLLLDESSINWTWSFGIVSLTILPDSRMISFRVILTSIYNVLSPGLVELLVKVTVFRDLALLA